MLLSLNWLKDFVNIPKNISSEELGLKLTMHTVEVDSVQDQREAFNNVVVGKLLEVKKHPNADKLQLASVDTGEKTLSIVCGAPNIQSGQMVPVALVGAVLPNGMEIKEVKVRGEMSQGMLCAEDELGLGSDHAGILILDGETKPGTQFAEYLGLKDVIYELDNKSITHRPDLWSHYGIAREIAAFLDIDFKEYKTRIGDIKFEEKEKIEVKVSDQELCPRYLAVVIDGIKIASSPEWMQKRLIATGMRPINNIVDITNYVMLELGQPLHAFDREMVDKIVVRRAKKQEKMETLDSEQRQLNENMLVIANSTKPMAIAGVMGGANSEISENTTKIIIESANFNFLSVRKTAQTLGMRTESSIRFEKALDPNFCELGLVRAIELIREVCPSAKVVSKIVDVNDFKLDQGPIEISAKWLNAILGQKIEIDKVINILHKLGFETDVKDDVLMVKVPTWRATRDINIKEDVVEEIARIFGYDNLEISMPKIEMETVRVANQHKLDHKIKSILSGAPGFSEVKNYSFVGEEQLKKLGIDYSTHIKLANPISSTQTMLRQNIAPNLLENVKNNQSRSNEFGLFEIGNVFLSGAGEYKIDAKSQHTLPYQEKRLGLIFAGDDLKYAFDQVKGTVKYLLDSYDITCVFDATETLPSWADRAYSARILGDKRELGFVATIDKKFSKGLGIKKQVAVAEISLNDINKAIIAKSQLKFQEFEKYPPVVRDVAFVVDAKILYNKIKQEIENFDTLIRSVTLFDVYTGEKIGKNKKSLAFNIIYQTNKTLRSEEIDKLQAKLVKFLEERFDAKIRDF